MVVLPESQACCSKGKGGTACSEQAWNTKFVRISVFRCEQNIWTEVRIWLGALLTCPNDSNVTGKYVDQRRAGLHFWVRITPVKSKELCLYQDDGHLTLAPVGLKFYPYTKKEKENASIERKLKWLMIPQILSSCRNGFLDSTHNCRSISQRRGKALNPKMAPCPHIRG